MQAENNVLHGLHTGLESDTAKCNQKTSPIIPQWDTNDASHPYNMSPWRKWVAVSTVSLGSLCVDVMAEFNCSREVATLGLSLFIWGMGTGPLVFGPLSELYGRRVIYIASFATFLVFLIPCAVAKNIQTLLIARFLDGFAGSAFLSVAGGTVGDIFPRHQLATPMMVYTASPFVGPELGPLRWTFYAMLCWAGAILLLICFFVPETYHALLLRRKAQELQKQTGSLQPLAPREKVSEPLKKLILRSIYRPMMLLTLEPMCLNLCVYSAILLGILYLFFGAFQDVFQEVYGFELWQRGLTFLGLLVGMILAVLSDSLWRSNYRRLERNHRSISEDGSDYYPEWRLPPAGAPLVTVGLFMFSWTTYPSIHWIVPIIGSALFGAGVVLVYSGIFTFLVDAYPAYAASALAANSFARSSFGGIFPLFGTQMYDRLGIHWASCLLAFLTLAMLPFPHLFFKYGPQIRKKSRFAA
ncbi:major facilitator superfamily domain-containing protein [Penicillium nucicola]|uniref:major facilitator superfamily domain-containing protein n=1 Tax=Penicillium nucicola TaxID=1850975 RepID=UPI0025455736|nr:major facilitator superfamily domain-containing protein [Penicillium nucicola]KAJ5775813.1 major facilitator superfamily domain-containing protein [Penicillium nucicola]